MSSTPKLSSPDISTTLRMDNLPTGKAVELLGTEVLVAIPRRKGNYRRAKSAHLRLLGFFAETYFTSHRLFLVKSSSVTHLVGIPRSAVDTRSSYKANSLRSVLLLPS